MARDNWCEISWYAIRENLLLVCSMAVLCFLFCFRKDGERKYFIVRRIDSMLIAGTSCYFFIVTYLLEWDSKIETYTIFALLDVVMCALFFVSIFMTVILFIDDKRSRYVSLFYLVSVLITIVPLLVVSLIGARCFYVSYIFSVISVLTLFAYVVKKEQWKVKRIWFPVCVVIVCVIRYYLYIFLNIKEVQVERDAYIVERMEEGDSVIEIPEFPFSAYLHDPHGWKIQLKYYYEESGDIEFLFMPYSEWKEEKKNYQ